MAVDHEERLVAVPVFADLVGQCTQPMHLGGLKQEFPVGLGKTLARRDLLFDRPERLVVRR